MSMLFDALKKIEKNGTADAVNIPLPSLNNSRKSLLPRVLLITAVLVAVPSIGYWFYLSNKSMVFSDAPHHAISEKISYSVNFAGKMEEKKLESTLQEANQVERGEAYVYQNIDNSPVSVQSVKKVDYKKDAHASSTHRSRREHPAREKRGRHDINKIYIEKRITSILSDALGSYKKGDFTKSYEQYRLALEYDSKNITAMLGMASAAQRKGDQTQAARLYEQVLNLSGQQPDALAALGLLSAQNDPVGWESKLALAIERYPRHAMLWHAYGVTLSLQQRWGAAADAFGRAASLAPDQPDYFYNQAIALEQARLYPEAIRAYRNALYLANDHKVSFDVNNVRKRIEQLENISRSHE